MRPAASPDEMAARPDPPGRAVRHQRVALVDLLDRVLATGVVVTGDVTLSIADVDLVTISLRALVSSVGEAGLVPGLDEEAAGSDGF
jgi:hypothetical protein